MEQSNEELVWISDTWIYNSKHFLLGINKLEKSNPLHELNTHIDYNLIFIKALHEKIEHKIEGKTILSFLLQEK